KKPGMQQPQYILLDRDGLENEEARLYEDIGLCTTIWSPLASGLLTGKYVDGIPEGSRASLPGYEWLRDKLSDPDANAKVKRLGELAQRLDVTTAQLAIAWCASNPHVSTVITGASSVQQVEENMKALDALARIDEVRDEIDELFSDAG